jgi:hypothetical protein
MGVTWNLSQGGMQVEVSNLQQGDPVRLSFRLPRSSVMLDTPGVVVWSKENRQSIQFTKMNAQNQADIQEFVDQIEETDWGGPARRLSRS